MEYRLRYLAGIEGGRWDNNLKTFTVSLNTQNPIDFQRHNNPPPKPKNQETNPAIENLKADLSQNPQMMAERIKAYHTDIKVISDRSTEIKDASGNLIGWVDTGTGKSNS